MRHTIGLLLPIALGVFLFNFLFWEEKLGLNALIFTVFYIPALNFLFPESRRAPAWWAAAIGTVWCAGMIVWHNSSAAKFGWLLSAMCAAGFAQEPELRFILRALFQYTIGWWQTPRHFLQALNSRPSPRSSPFRLGKWVEMSFIPLVVVAVFYLLYRAANKHFAELADQFWAELGRWLSFDISWSHLFFVLFGFFLIGAAFWRNQTKLAERDKEEHDFLTRARPSKPRRGIARGLITGLKREFQQSNLLLWLLNVLLLVVNLTDVRYVWFGFNQEALQDLKGYVHEGTYFLIASILLAMFVLLYVFRKNLHFYPNSSRLRLAAAIWLVQNGILAASVAMRNFRYIEYHGLAYKRIGVILFLMLVFFGLVTLFMKIRDARTKSWLWRQNAWALYAVILLNASIAWDAYITRYNLSGAPRGAIDIKFMIYEVSDKNIYLLEDRLNDLPGMAMYPQLTAEEITQGVLRKRQYFEEKMARLTWKSWNGGDIANAR